MLSFKKPVFQTFVKPVSDVSHCFVRFDQLVTNALAEHRTVRTDETVEVDVISFIRSLMFLTNA